jgi:hypothetical protein
VAARGERWRHPWGPGSGAWGGAKGTGDRALAWRCSNGEGWRVVAHGDRRGGGAPGDRGVACEEGLGVWRSGIGGMVLGW